MKEIRSLFDFKVGSLTYDVVEDKTNTRTENYHGKFSSVDQKIYLDPDQTGERRLQSFLHEMLHAIFYECGLCHLLSNKRKLSEEELIILEILKEGEKESSEIYEIIMKKISRSKRQIRNYLGSLVQKGHIEAREFDDTNSMLKPKIYRVCQRRLDEVYD